MRSAAGQTYSPRVLEKYSFNLNVVVGNGRMVAYWIGESLGQKAMNVLERFWKYW